jgi:dolichol-phosphate mannosyltransferase
MTISIVIPAYNEAESIVPLVKEIAEATRALPVKEIIVVNDCSDDNMVEALNALKPAVPQLRVIHHTVRSGQSTGIRTGVQQATSPLIVTMDGDGQNDPADIAALYVIYQQHETVNPRTLVAGQRLKRQDNLIRILSSRIANGVRAAILKDGVRDTGCGLKLFRREDFLDLPFFNHLHRFIPVLMRAKGVNIVLVDVAHRPRTLGTSKYGVWNRVWVGIADMFGVRWIVGRMKPPVGVRE